MFSHVLILSLLTVIPLNGDSYALIDEVRTDLERAKVTVEAAIRAADARYDGYRKVFATFSNNVQMEGEIVIGYEEQVFFGQVDAIDQLAQSTGVDISTCKQYEKITNATSESIDALKECISPENEEVEKMLDQYSYLTHITINTIMSLEVQLGRCNENNEDCILPLHELIKWELQHRREFIENHYLINSMVRVNKVKVVVQDCYNLNVSYYISYVNSILQEVSQCAANLIG